MQSRVGIAQVCYIVRRDVTRLAQINSSRMVGDSCSKIHTSAFAKLSKTHCCCAGMSQVPHGMMHPGMNGSMMGMGYPGSGMGMPGMGYPGMGMQPGMPGMMPGMMPGGMSNMQVRAHSRCPFAISTSSW